MNRREFLGQAALAYGAGNLLFSHGQAVFAEGKPVAMEPLPFAEADFEPVISAKTFSFHHGKHYAAYVDKANELLAKNPLAGKPVEEIMQALVDKPDQAALFNNVAQAWNHAFFWKSLKPKSGKPEGAVAKLIDDSFGGFDKFRDEFVNAAKAQFGSGWVWLVLDSGKLKIERTANADNPLAHNRKPVFTVDVWEHAYYLDYQNRRADFVKDILEKAANWEFVGANIEKK